MRAKPFSRSTLIAAAELPEQHSQARFQSTRPSPEAGERHRL
jgi:hypothetical protein